MFRVRGWPLGWIPQRDWTAPGLNFYFLLPLDQCFSTSGPQSSKCGPPGFSNSIKNQNLRHKFQKKYLKIYLISYKSIKKHQNELILTQLSVWNKQNLRWGAKMFILVFGGPPCFHRWEPLHKMIKQLVLIPFIVGSFFRFKIDLRQT
jgi:hypothetical protein